MDPCTILYTTPLPATSFSPSSWYVLCTEYTGIPGTAKRATSPFLTMFSLERRIVVEDDGHHAHVAEGPPRPAQDVLPTKPHLTRDV